MRPRALLCAALLAATACKRPVEGRDLGATLLYGLSVEPEHVRAGVPIALHFSATGAPPTRVTWEIAGRGGDCAPTHEDDGRWLCTAPAFTRDQVASGPVLAVVAVRDAEGHSSIASAPLTLDFDCPRLVALSISAPIAEPGDKVVVAIEASEDLSTGPEVTRAGRPWEQAVGSGRTYSVTHSVSVTDPQQTATVRVRLVDLAGNTSGDCGADGELDFAVDLAAPTIDLTKVSVVRDAPGSPSVITASTAAFLDDVGLAEVRVLDGTGGQVLARVVPDATGGLPATTLGVQPASRVLLEAVDRFGRVSPRVAVPERWRLSIGTGSTPNAGLRTGSRRTPAPPHTRAMQNRTIAGAPDVFRADTRSLTVRTQVTFEKVGDLPSRYEDVNHIIAGYEPTGHTVVAAGGNRGRSFGVYANYVEDVLLISWDEESGSYLYEQGPTLAPTGRDLESQLAGGTPGPRYGRNLAFDGAGCGLMFSGDVLYLEDDGGRGAAPLPDFWQLCRTAGGYSWRRIPLPGEIDGNGLGRIAPIVWDPLNRYYVIAGGDSDNPVLFVEPGPTPADWQVSSVAPLPSAFVTRYEHLLFYDERAGGFAMGLGNSEIGSGQQRQLWLYSAGQWSLSTVPQELSFRIAFGSAYDEARRQLVLWGGTSGYPGDPSDPTLWLMTGTSTEGPSAWRSTLLDHPVARDWPSLVYDPDREVTLVFGGVRRSDTRFVPPEIHQIIAEPSSPFVQASVDLAAARPKGIERLHLEVRATGTGDGDDTGRGTTPGGGVVVLLWDHDRLRWYAVATSEDPPGTASRLFVDVTRDPERYIGRDGTVPVTITTRHAATEAVAARLDLDLLDGWLELRAGVTLP